jgi:hypothetical protein
VSSSESCQRLRPSFARIRHPRGVAVVPAGCGAASADGRADGIGCRHPGRAPELCAWGSYPSRDGHVTAHTLAAASIIGWLGLGPFAACTGGVIPSARITGSGIAAMRTVAHSWCVSTGRSRTGGGSRCRPPAYAAPRSCRAAAAVRAGRRAPLTGSRAPRFFTSSSTCAIRGLRISTSGACREWQAFEQPDRRRGSERVRAAIRLPGPRPGRYDRDALGGRQPMSSARPCADSSRCGSVRLERRSTSFCTSRALRGRSPCGPTRCER